MNEKIKRILEERIHVELSQHVSKCRQESDSHIGQMKVKQAAQGVIFGKGVIESGVHKIQSKSLKESVEVILKVFEKVLITSKTILDEDCVKQIKGMARVFYKSYYEQGYAGLPLVPWESVIRDFDSRIDLLALEFKSTELNLKATPLKRIKIFLSGPSDTDVEMETIEDVIKAWGDNHSDNYQVIFTTSDWKTQASSQMGAPPQEIINVQALTNCDYLFVVFKSRFGTPTNSYSSGTEHEFEWFKKNKTKDVISVYFCSGKGFETNDQYKQVLGFKERIKTSAEGLYEEFGTEASLRKAIEKRLTYIAKKEKPAVIGVSLNRRDEIERSTSTKFEFADAKDGPARFREPNIPIGFRERNFVQNEKNIFLTSGPAIWLRVFPSINLEKQWPISELKKMLMENAIFLNPLISPGGSYSYLRGPDGVGYYFDDGMDSGEEDRKVIDGVTFVFKTGEIWSVDMAVMKYCQNQIQSSLIETAFSGALDRYSKFLLKLGVMYPYCWKAGLVGLKGKSLSYNPPPLQVWRPEFKGPTFASDLVEEEGMIVSGKSSFESLMPFFQKIFDECGEERPSYLSQ